MTQRQPHEAFGPHLVMEGWGSPRERLKDLALIHAFLLRLPELIDMTMIMPPQVVKRIKAPSGYSAAVLIAESHIFLHTYPEEGRLHLDIFSCQEFDQKLAMKSTAAAFRVKEWTHQVFERGLEFGRNLPAAMEHLLQGRRYISGKGGWDGG